MDTIRGNFLVSRKDKPDLHLTYEYQVIPQIVGDSNPVPAIIGWLEVKQGDVSLGKLEFTPHGIQLEVPKQGHVYRYATETLGTHHRILLQPDENDIDPDEMNPGSFALTIAPGFMNIIACTTTPEELELHIDRFSEVLEKKGYAVPISTQWRDNVRGDENTPDGPARTD